MKSGAVLKVVKKRKTLLLLPGVEVEYFGSSLYRKYWIIS
jgi:hypothetical protein